jgi:hypothetical protein
MCGYLLKDAIKKYDKKLTNPLTYYDIFEQIQILYDVEKRKIYNVFNWNKLIKKCIKSKKRFICDIIGIFNEYGGHANALIIDNKNKTIERFEPHGSVTNMYNMDEFDNDLRKFFKKSLPNYIYVSPKTIEKEYGPQGLSQEGLESFKKIGDPGGFCLTWSFAYIDLRLSNPNIPAKNVLDAALKIINNKGLKIIDYIRMYVKIIYKLREDILETVGLTYDDLLAVNMSPEQGKKIIKLMKF